MFDTIIKEAASKFGLGDKAGPLVQMLVGYMTDSKTGGLTGFMDKFKSAGLGSIASSWLGGSGAPQAISTSQVESLFGGSGGLLGMITSKLGIGGSVASTALAGLLPTVIGKLTPGGSIPTSFTGELGNFVSGAKGMLSGGVASAGAAAGAGVAAIGAGANAMGGAAKSAGGGLMKWLPWLIAALAAVFLWSYCAKPAGDAAKKAADATKSAAGAAAGAATAAAGAATDATKAAAGAAVDATKAAAGAAVDATQAAAGAAAGAATAAAGAATDATKAAAGAAVDATKTAAGAVAGAASTAAGAAAGAATDAAKAVADALPKGAGALASMFEGAPMLKVYFDSGKADLSADFGDKAKAVIDHLKANAGTKAVISGFTDSTGDITANAELSKKRALAVAGAIKAAGFGDDRIVMEKPAGATTGGTAATNAEGRRVEVKIRK